MRLVFRDLASLLVAGVSLVMCCVPAVSQERSATAVDLKKQNQACFQCHKSVNPALADEWHGSVHAQKGVGCYDCHRAEKADIDAFEHNGATIAVIVSPKDCGRCHQNEVDQQKGSHHAKAGEILASLDNFLG